jgi:hypothetical protein
LIEVNQTKNEIEMRIGMNIGEEIYTTIVWCGQPLDRWSEKEKCDIGWQKLMHLLINSNRRITGKTSLRSVAIANLVIVLLFWMVWRELLDCEEWNERRLCW